MRSAVRALALAMLALATPALALEVRVTDGADRPLAGAVVFLESAAATAAVTPLAEAEIGQRDKTFIPDQLVVTRGTAVNFPNRDTVRHHVYSFSPAKPFELKLYTGTPAEPVVFDRAGVVVLGCNIHDHMVAWVLVLDTPWHAVTDASGRAVISGAPAGDHQLRAWHRSLPPGVEVPARAVTLPADTRVTLRIDGARP